MRRPRHFSPARALLLVALFIPPSLCGQIPTGLQHDRSGPSNPPVVPAPTAQRLDEIPWNIMHATQSRAHPIRAAEDTRSFYKRKGEWQKIIDEYWGPGAPLAEKQRIFNVYANYIQRYFTAFEGLGISWDSLRAHYYSQINDSTSYGRFSAVLSYMAYALRELHTGVVDFTLMAGLMQGETSGINEPRWGKPVWIKCEMAHARHFGAVLTPLADSSAVVIRAMKNHPLNLQPGDVVLGYEGVPWRQIARELLAAEVPTIILYGGSRSMEMHRLLASAGFNWHLFDTIDIVKYGTGDTLHLPVDSLASIVMMDTLYNNECLEVPGVPWPDWWWVPLDARPNTAPVTSGIVAGTNIGYIYISQHTYRGDGDRSPDSEERFNQAIADLWNTGGLIIDLRGDHGGRVNANFNSAFGKLINFDTHTLDYYWRQGSENLTALTPYPYFPVGTLAIDADEETVYDHPIAVLVGPGCMSMGDITAYRLTYFPNVRFFGKPTSMGWGGGGEKWPGGIQRPQVQGYILPASEIMLRDHHQPDRDLERIKFPVDEDVWLLPEDIVKGEDTVVKRALQWIQSVAHSCDVRTSSGYYRPGKDRLQLTSRLVNPAGHAVSLTALVKTGPTLLDSIALADDGTLGDAAAGDGVWGASWAVPDSERFYSVGLRVSDPSDPTTYTMPYAARFTTVGPVACVGDTTFADPEWGQTVSLRLKVANKGLAIVIPGVKGAVRALDTAATVAPIGNPFEVGDINPAETRLSSVVRITFSKWGSGVRDLPFELVFSSGGIEYWRDTLRIHVQDAVGVDVTAELPTSFALGQNYPNPFNSNTIIHYQLPIDNYVSLKVYDLLGCEVALLVDEKKAPGSYEVQFHAKGLASGVYLYRLTAGAFVETRKMLLLQ